MSTRQDEVTAVYFAPFVSSPLLARSSSPTTPTLHAPFDGVVAPPRATAAQPLRMTDYQALLERAQDEALGLCGLDVAEAAARDEALVALETRVTHHRPLRAEEQVRITLHLLACDDSRLHGVFSIHLAAGGELVATAEQVIQHVSLVDAQPLPFRPAVRQALADMLSAHARLPRPQSLGRGLAPYAAPTLN
jgi:acyl-CoA thioester hydrolase